MSSVDGGGGWLFDGPTSTDAAAEADFRKALTLEPALTAAHEGLHKLVRLREYEPEPEPVREYEPEPEPDEVRSVVFSNSFANVQSKLYQNATVDVEWHGEPW